MTRQEMLFTLLAEESVEVAQRCTKILRFGLAEKQPGQETTNIERLLLEVIDLFAVLEVLKDAIPDDDLLLDADILGDLDTLVDKKKAKIEKYLAYSKECGTLVD